MKDVIETLSTTQRAFLLQVITDVQVVLKQRDELLAVLELAVEQMESDAVQIESEWGCGWGLDKIEKAGQLPEAILKARDLISRVKACAVTVANSETQEGK